MSVSARRLLPMLLGAMALMGLALPGAAQAHGIVGRADLPIPVWLFSWTAAIVLVVSFVALSTLWQSPRLQEPRERVLFHLAAPFQWLAGALGLGLFVLVVYSGFAGAQVGPVNFADTFIYVIFWVGLPLASVLAGDVFAAFNPWRTTARLLDAVLTALRRAPSREPLLRYPQKLGRWPAVAGIVGFAWLELVYIEREVPSTLAALSLGYFILMVLGMSLFGVRTFSEQADGFGVYFNLLSRLSPLRRRDDGAVCIRRPLSGITGLELSPGTLGVIFAVIGTTTFDGFSNGGIWRNNEPNLQSAFSDLGFGPGAAQELAYSVGLVLCIVLIAVVYRVGIVGVRSVSDRYPSAELTRSFAHTLVPIGFAYVLAHYFSLLIWQSQAMGFLISDPLGNGANIFGTAHAEIDYGVISFAAIWYVQVAALLMGHVAGLALAHDRALVLYRDPEDAIRSQYWMLAVMVAFTSFGLWLLSSVGT